MSSEGARGVGNVGGIGASSCARELAKRRVSSTAIQTPTTPVTPVALSTPVLAAHIFAEGNIMEDLQLAAELGKTLLERNKDLENTIKEQRCVIDDKTQEIEYLSKQTAALREVNDSRLRIYEQLEISIQELENSNQRLTSESNADRKKIKSLTSTIDHLEVKCDELQKYLDDAKALQNKQLKQQLQQEEDQYERGRTISRRLQSPEENIFRRSMSCENPSQCCENLATECVELQMKVESLQAKLRATQEEARMEIKKREDLEIELECASQENAVLREQISVLKEKENNVRSFEDELASVDDTSSSKICRKCMGLADETGSSITMQDFTEDIEDMDASYEAAQGDCALVRLQNGGYAWGSQESLASMGQVVSCSISHESSPRTDASEAPNSLLSELDTQYRILIEKYEALLEAREKHEMHEKMQIQPPPPQTLIDSGVDEMSGPMSLVMTDIGSSNKQSHVSVLCQRCTTCSCDLKLSNNRPSNLEEHSEVETSSSGFSEGETRLCSKMTQTDISDYIVYNKEYEDDATPTPLGNNITQLDLQTPMNPCESRFQTAPIYRRIFHEIFEVLKKDVDKEHIEVDIIKIYDSGKEYIDNISTENKSAKQKNKPIDASLRDENEENKNPNVRNKEAVSKKEAKETKVNLEETRHKEDSKPFRPDFLDLDSSSRCSSRSRRRKRQLKHRNNNQQSTTEPGKQNESEPVSLEVMDQEKPEPPAPVNTPAIIPSIPNVSSIPPKEKVLKEPPRPLNANKERCEHKRRKNKRQSRSYQPLQNKLFNKVMNQNPSTSNSRYQPSAWSYSGSIPAPQNLPSVQVAKLIKFERTYAEVLKSRRS